MSLPFIAFHMADYQRDTMQLPLEGHGAYFLLLQHCWSHGNIPADDSARAAICKVTVTRWKKQLAPLVAGYFDTNGENKRASAEIAKAEKLRTRQAMAGHRGAEKRWGNHSHGHTTAKPRLDHGVTTKKEDITSTSVGTARASGSATEPIEKPKIETTGSLQELIVAKRWVQS